jgi:hypothetical protein
MKRGEKLRESQREIWAHYELLKEARAREKAALERRAAIRVVGGTDYEERTA